MFQKPCQLSSPFRPGFMFFPSQTKDVWNYVALPAREGSHPLRETKNDKGSAPDLPAEGLADKYGNVRAGLLPL